MNLKDGIITDLSMSVLHGDAMRTRPEWMIAVNVRKLSDSTNYAELVWSDVSYLHPDRKCPSESRPMVSP